MSKSKKKRDKQYAGKDATTKPTVHRYQAIERSPIQEWWLSKKRPIKIIAGIIGAAIIVVWLLAETLRLIFG